MPTRSRARQSSGASTVDLKIARLYALPLTEFTPARNALVTRLRKSGRQDQAEVVKALKKPTLPVWAINQVARQEPAAVRAFM
jgi:hypothetical protein